MMGMYFDIYNNRFFAEDDGSSSSAHYSDYYFGAVDTDTLTLVEMASLR